MSSKSKRKNEPKFSHIVIRLILFLCLLTLGIYFLSTRKANYQTMPSSINVDTSTVADQVYSKIPDSSRSKLEEWGKIPIISTITNTVSEFQKNQSEFISQKIKEFKIWLIKSISQELIDRIN